MEPRDVEAALGLPGMELRQALGRLLAVHGPAMLAAWTDASKHANHIVHRLAIIGDSAALELLASSGVDVNCQRRSDLCTPLHLAIWNGQPLVAQVLRRLGADPDSKNSFGETARDAERLRDRRYVCWHQQADILVNVSPIILRRLFRERWAMHIGNALEVGATILHGSDERLLLSKTASTRRGSIRLRLEEDVSGTLFKGQLLWLEGLEVEVAGQPIWTPPRGRLLGGCEVTLEKAWAGLDVQQGQLHVQRVPAEPRLPPGTDAYKKIRSGRVDTWDLTLLGHFLGEEQCRLASRLVPKSEHRQAVRQMKDARNKVCLHQGRTEVEPDVVNATARLLQDACDVLLPALSAEVEHLMEEARSRTVVPESMLEDMEHQLSEEREKGKLMQECVTSVSRFRSYLPAGAFAGVEGTPSTAVENLDVASEWSATRGKSVWTSTGPHQVYECGDELIRVLALPQHCDVAVISHCLTVAASCPQGNSLLIVVRTAASAMGDVMLDELGDPNVHKRWKERRLIMADVSPSAELFEDWCLPDGVLVSGEHGRVLRVTAQYRPPEGVRRIKGKTLRRALDVACATDAVVIVGEGGAVYASTSQQAAQDEYFQLVEPSGADSDGDLVSVYRGADTLTEAGAQESRSTAQKVGKMFWPHMQQREQLTQTLLPQAEEQVRRWSTGVAEINGETAELASDNTAKWLWTFICADQPLDAIQAAQQVCSSVLKRLQDLGFHVYEPRLLIPLGESHRILSNLPDAISLFSRARRLGSEYCDFENGFSAHHMLFNIYVRLEKVAEARAMLLGAQLILDKESASQREGPGMNDFFRAKRVFLKSNQARLDAKVALKSEDPVALRKVASLLEETIQEMTEMQGDQFRGNTNKNMAELLCLLCKVAWGCGDTARVRRALERELPLRRTRAQEPEAVVTLANLGRVCLETGDLHSAERYLSEAELTMQGLPAVSHYEAVRREVLWMLATCSERQQDPAGALTQLNRLAEVLPRNLDDGSVGKEIARVQALRDKLNIREARSQGCTESLPSTAGTEDLRELGELVEFIEGGSGTAKANKASKGKEPERGPDPEVKAKPTAKKKKAKPKRRS